jgi:hypothetical protein
MNDLTIKCPKCKHIIKLTEELAGPLLESTKQEYEQKIAGQVDAFNAELTTARRTIEAEALKKASAKVEDDFRAKTTALEDSEARLYDISKKLAEAQRVQAEFLKKQRALDDEKREMDLTIEKRVAGGIDAVRISAKVDAEEMFKLKLSEKEQTLTSMQQQIEILKRKAEQGSQQLQGEVQELDMENQLKKKFPHDAIQPVAKGVMGGDIAQLVFSDSGLACGSILWESKRTKAWSDGWLPKLRDDQRAAKADIAILVTETLPKGVGAFSADLIDGVWVVHVKAFMALAIALHQHLVDLQAARKAGEGQETKMGMVYEYLTGPRFKQRVQAIVEAFSTMKEDLDKEKKAILKQWAKRDEQIDRVLQGTVGMVGDLQGIAGKSMGEVEGLSMAALEAHTD